MEKKIFQSVQDKYFPKYQIPQRYSIIKVIGKGSYGCVAMALDQLTKTKVAIKKIPALFDDLIDGKRVLRQIIVLKNTQNRCLVKLLDLFTYPTNKFNTIFIVTSYEQSDLKRLLDKNIPLNMAHIQSISYQILLGLQYLHQRRIVHRDIKPANILINRDSFIKICDFGLARSVNGVAKPWYQAIELQQKMDEHEKKTAQLQNLKEQNKYLDQQVIKEQDNQNEDAYFDFHKKQGRKDSVKIQTTTTNNNSTTVTKAEQQGKKKKNTLKKTATNVKKQEPQSIKGSPFNNNTTSNLKSVISFNVVTRWYRSPQIILMQHYTCSVDLWSFGCVFGQLLRNVIKKQKDPLFQGKSCFPLEPDNNVDRVLQTPKSAPKYIISQNDQLNKIFDILGTPDIKQLGWISQQGVVQYVSKSFSKRQSKNLYEFFDAQQDESNRVAVDFLKCFITFDPRNRITIKQALKHPFFNGVARVPQLQEIPNEPPIDMEFEDDTQELDLERLRGLFIKQVKQIQKQQQQLLFKQKK